MLIGDANGEALRDLLALGQVLHRRVGITVGAVVQGVSPFAGVAVQRQAAVGARGIALNAPVGRAVLIDVDHVEGAAGGEGAVFFGGAAVFTCREGDDRFVVATRNRQRDELITEGALVIGDAHRELVLDGLVLRQVLNNGGRSIAAVVQGVGPFAGVAIEGQASVNAIGISLDFPVLCCSSVAVGCHKRSAGRDGDVFLNAAAAAA